MREFLTSLGDTVDLDDKETYSYMSTDVKVVRREIHKEIGFYYVYVNYWHKGWDDAQEARAEALIQRYADEWRENINNLQWHQEMLFIFQDEIENMC